MGQIQFVAEVEIVDLEAVEGAEVLGLSGPLLADLVEATVLLVEYHLEPGLLDLVDLGPEQLAHALLRDYHVQVVAVQEAREADDAVGIAYK